MGLNKGQKECKAEFSKWNRTLNKQTFEVDGPAGVGKTYMAKELIRASKLEPENLLCMAYTGRACMNLSLKGLPASSIHSSLYEYIEVPKLDSDDNPIYRHGRKVTMMAFKKRQYLPKTIKRLLVDESSFINEEVGKHILSYDIPVMVFGDNAQLNPIIGKPMFLVNPDYTLTEIVRQAKHSGIIELATRIRLGQEIPDKKYQFKEDCFILPKKDITDTILLNSEMILCGTNRSRNHFNNRIRRDLLGITAKLPVKSDKLICRSNLWNRVLNNTCLVNGTVGSLAHPINISEIDTKNRTALIDFRPEYIDYDYYEALPMDIDYFLQPCGSKEETFYNRAAKIEMGYAITCHLSQGSEFTSALYWDEPWGDEEHVRRMRYTGITRAKDVLVYAI